MAQNDLISRSALMKDKVWFCGGCITDPYVSGYMDALDKVEEVILSAQAVERPKGRWNIVEFNSNSRTVVIECPECSAVFEVDSFSFGLNYNFCHNCGADLRGEDDA